MCVFFLLFFYLLVNKVDHMSAICIQRRIVGDVFTALHGMQTRSSDENSVCPSVCLSVRLSVCQSVRLSVTRVDCDKTVERSVQIYIPYERTFSLVF